MHSRILVLLLAIAGVAGANAAQDAVAGRVAVLLATLPPPSSEPIPFVERRMSSLLAAPIEVRGSLRIGTDGSIDKRVTAPVEEHILITRGSLTLERRGQSRTINLAGDPRWRAFHAGIAGLMNRDPEALGQAFDVSLEEGSDGWRLDLRPKGPRRKAMIELISAFGRGQDLLRLRLDQGDGEWQEMTFLPPGS